jgi:hypothetical protein
VRSSAALLFALFAPCAFANESVKLELPSDATPLLSGFTHEPAQSASPFLKKLDDWLAPEHGIGTFTFGLKAASGLPKDETFCLSKADHLTLEHVPDFLSGLEVAVSIAL